MKKKDEICQPDTGGKRRERKHAEKKKETIEEEGKGIDKTDERQNDTEK